MIGFYASVDAFDTQAMYITFLMDRLFDLRPFAPRAEQIMQEQNLLMRDVGHDRYDVPFVELAESTMKRRVRQGRMGPPLAPDGIASDIIGGFTVRSEIHQPDDITVIGEWPGLPWVKYHTDNADARYHLPVRDPVGMPAYAQEQVMVEFEEYIIRLLAQTF
jgi:hypothetical protein